MSNETHSDGDSVSRKIVAAAVLSIIGTAMLVVLFSQSHTSPLPVTTSLSPATNLASCSGRQSVQAGGIWDAKRTKTGTNADGNPTSPICPQAGGTTIDEKCMVLLKLPETYQFMESAASCESCDYAYVPAVKCSKDGKPDPKCSKSVMSTDVYKIYPGKYQYNPTNPRVFLGTQNKAFTINNFKSFGSKLTKDGKLLFICDLDHGRVIAVNTGTGKIEMAINEVVSPNDIAIWEKGTNEIILYIAGGYGIVNQGAYTGIWEVKVRDATGQWVTDKNKKPCASATIEAGCSFQDISDNNKKNLENTYITMHTCAGIGLDFSKNNPDGRPNVWTSELDQFVRLSGKTEGYQTKQWGLVDKSWHGDYQCTLPQETLSSKTWDLNYGLIDNIAMADKNTMLTAIYTDCAEPTASNCLINDYAGGYMYDEKTKYQAVAFTKTCVNKYKDTLGKDISSISETYVQSVSKFVDFSGRITHIQNVKNDLLAINYQASGILVFKGAVEQLTDSCTKP